jgi:hypothetical protein
VANNGFGRSDRQVVERPRPRRQRLPHGRHARLVQVGPGAAGGEAAEASARPDGCAAPRHTDLRTDRTCRARAAHKARGEQRRR